MKKKHITTSEYYSDHSTNIFAVGDELLGFAIYLLDEMGMSCKTR